MFFLNLGIYFYNLVKKDFFAIGSYQKNSWNVFLQLVPIRKNFQNLVLQLVYTRKNPRNLFLRLVLIRKTLGNLGAKSQKEIPRKHC